MAKNNKTGLIILIVAIIIILLAVHSFYSVGVTGSRQIYIVTYEVSQGAVGGNLAAQVYINGTSVCNTQIRHLSLGYKVTETDFPVTQGSIALINQEYASGSSGNITLCIYSLPPGINSTRLVIWAINQTKSAEWSSKNYSLNVTIAQGASPLLFTIPLTYGPQVVYTTVSTTTSSSTTSASTTLAPGQSSTSSTTSTSTSTSTTTIPQQPQPNIWQAFITWLTNLYNEIVQALGFKVSV